MTELFRIRQVMHAPTAALHEDTCILDAAATLLREDVPSAPVVDRDGRLVGVLSERDCLKLLAEGDPVDHDVPRGTVGDVMTREPATLPPDLDVAYAAGRFLREPYRTYPVVDDAGRLLGEVSRREVLRAVHGTLRAAQWQLAGSGGASPR